MARKGSYAERRLAELGAPVAETTPSVTPEHIVNVGGAPVCCESAEAAAGLRTALQGIHDLMFRTGAL